MYISQVRIKNFRNFRDCIIPLNEGLSVIIGENNIGKTNLLAALSLLFSPDASTRSRQLKLEDFHVESLNDETPPEIVIACTLAGIDSEADKTVAATWLVSESEARVTYEYRCSPRGEQLYKRGEHLPLDYYEWSIYGGEKKTRVLFEFDQLKKITLEVFGALRDAERDLQPNARGRVANLLKHFGVDKTEKTSIESAITALNDQLSEIGQITGATQLVNKWLGDIAGRNAQKVELTPVESKYEDLIRTLRVVVNSAGSKPRDVSWNGLGYNNLLFVSFLLAECTSGWEKEDSNLILPITAIEEPEAHLHPHLQKMLNRNLAQVMSKAQVITTTHSTHITSSVSLDSLILLNRASDGCTQAVRVGSLFDERDERLKRDLERYLDATKSTLFFARSVILVEGIAELLLIPVMACKYMKDRFSSDSKRKTVDLDEAGISVVAVHGISFRPFLKLFGPDAIHRRCAVLTDSDTKDYPLTSPDDPRARIANLRNEYRNNPFVSFHLSAETFEYDLAIATEGDPNDRYAPISNEARILEALHNTEGIAKSKIPKAGEIKLRQEFGKQVACLVKNNKGRFAQSLADVILADVTSEGFVIPPYIKEALEFVMGD